MKIFFDMDGTLCEYRYGEPFESLFEKGYFRSLLPNDRMVKAARILSKDHEVFVLSSVFAESRYAQREKNLWLNEFLPEIPRDHRLFPACGEYGKLEYAKLELGKIDKDDVLVDDYGKNRGWEAEGTFVKVSRNYRDFVEEAKRFDKAIYPSLPTQAIIDVITGKLSTAHKGGIL